MSKWILAVSLAGLMGGCATCREHPVACSIGSAVIVGSIAATVAANSGHNHDDHTASASLCGKPGNAVIGSCVGH